MFGKLLKSVGLAAFIGLVSVGTEVNAQNVLDGVYIKEHTPQRRVIPYSPLREADVHWARRVWRTLDLREKMNHPLYYPIQKMNDRQSLVQLIRENAEEGTIAAYSPMDDEFKQQMSPMEIQDIGVKNDTMFIEDDETGEVIPKVIHEDFDPATVKRYRVKEQWFVDRQRSVMDVRVIGICPVRESYDEAGEYRGDAPMFWIYFPEARNIFANSEVYNFKNDAERRTFEDIFWKRMFSSYITKESNVYDRQFDEYLEGVDALLEAEKVKEKFRNFEVDMWEY